MEKARMRVLFVAAGSSTNRLHIDHEVRAILEKVRSASSRDQLEMVTMWALRASDLQRSLLEVRPTILHFSGLDSVDGIVLENDAGERFPAKAGALVNLLSIFKRDLRCVVLSNCGARLYAERLAEVVDCVIQIASIPEEAATEFSSSFYQAIAFGRDIKEAFDLGRATIRLHGISSDADVTLFTREGVDPSALIPEQIPASPVQLRPALQSTARSGSGSGDDGGTERPGSVLPEPAHGARIFCVSDREDRAWIYDLEKHISTLAQQGLVHSFQSEASIPPGADVDAETERLIDEADIILLLITADFVASTSVLRQVTRALDRHRGGAVHVVPILVRSVFTEGAPWSGFQVLPRDGRPIKSWDDIDLALLDVVQGIKNVITYGVPKSAARRTSLSDDHSPAKKESLTSVGGRRLTTPQKILPISEIFSTTGQPDVTFVEPAQLKQLRIFIKMMGKGLVVEGPSGIGKTTAVQRAVNELGDIIDVTWIRGSDETDVAHLDPILTKEFKGHVVIDDFHRLDDAKKAQVARRMKAIADKSRRDTKITVIGVNPVGASLVVGFPDLAGRFEIISMRKQPDSKINELIAKGERAANIILLRRDEFINAAEGSFYTAQELCFRAAINQGIEETQRELKDVHCGPRDVVDAVMTSLGFRYHDTLSTFASYDGVVAGRGACLALLWLLSQESDGCISIKEAQQRYPNLDQTFSWLQGGNLKRCFQENQGLARFFFYNERAGVLSIEDPQLEFYLRNLRWASFARRNGHRVRLHPKRGLIFEELE